VVGLDIRPTEVLAVRMNKSGASLTVSAVEALPFAGGKPDGGPRTVRLPQKLRAPYASLAVLGADSAVKQLTFPGPLDAEAESKLATALGVPDPERYRIGYRTLTETHGKGEVLVLCVAIQDTEAQEALRLVRSGRPAPYSLEVSGLAGLSAFMHVRGADSKTQAIGALSIGPEATYLGFFYRHAPILVRKLDLGGGAVVAKVRESLGVDEQTAMGIVTGGAVDISNFAAETAQTLLDRVIVSRDYVERRENCHVRGFYAFGDLSLAREILNHLRATIEVDAWDPFSDLKVAEGAIAESAGDRSRFAAALGACLTTLEGP
jgi:Tfp pilus assembly PilM family ATPase